MMLMMVEQKYASSHKAHLYIQLSLNDLEHEAEVTNNRSLHLSRDGSSHRKVKRLGCALSETVLGRSAVQAGLIPRGQLKLTHMPVSQRQGCALERQMQEVVLCRSSLQDKILVDN